MAVDSPFYLLNELTIKGNDITIASSHEMKQSQELEQLSSYEKALLTGEAKPKTMPTIQQELRLMDMNRNFVELSSDNLCEEQREGVSAMQEYEQGDYVSYKGKLFVIDNIAERVDRINHLGRYCAYGDIKYEVYPIGYKDLATALKYENMKYLYHSELEKVEPTFAELIREIEKNKSPKYEIVTAKMSPLEKFLIKVTELVDGLLDSIKGIFKQQPKDNESLASTGVLQAIYAYVDGFLPCPTETRDRLAVFVSEYKKINSENKKSHVINKIGDTIKIVHYELERDKGDMEKVNQIIVNMIEYIRLINETDKSNVNAKLELEYDYMKKLLEDTRNAKRVSQGDMKSFEDILKEDGFEINRD